MCDDKCEERECHSVTCSLQESCETMSEDCEWHICEYTEIQNCTSPIDTSEETPSDVAGIQPVQTTGTKYDPQHKPLYYYTILHTTHIQNVFSMNERLARSANSIFTSRELKTFLVKMSRSIPSGATPPRE